MLPDALDCSISISEFYNLTISEVELLRDSYIRRYNLKRKNVADMLFRLSQLITNGTSVILNGKKVKPLEFLDIFSDIFPEEVIARDNKKLEIEKANMIAWAEAMNKKFTKEGGS